MFSALRFHGHVSISQSSIGFIQLVARSHSCFVTLNPNQPSKNPCFTIIVGESFIEVFENWISFETLCDGIYPGVATTTKTTIQWAWASTEKAKKRNQKVLKPRTVLNDLSRRVQGAAGSFAFQVKKEHTHTQRKRKKQLGHPCIELRVSISYS